MLSYPPKADYIAQQASLLIFFYKQVFKFTQFALNSSDYFLLGIIIPFIVAVKTMTKTRHLGPAYVSES